MTTFLPHQRFTIFNEDDVTPMLGTVDGSGNVTVPTGSTDPASARPYMIRVLDQGESSVDFLNGSSTTGQLNLSVLDKRTVATDQTTGWFTALLAGADGQNKLIGHRILVEQQSETGGSWYVLIDGVIGDQSLDSDYVTYTLSIRDIRERERKVRAFVKSSGLSLFPAGLINGYGYYGANGLGANMPLLRQPSGPAIGKFIRDAADSNVGLIAVDVTKHAISDERRSELISVMAAIPVFTSDSLNRRIGSLANYVYGNIRMYWRVAGSGGAYTILSNMPVRSLVSVNSDSAAIFGSYTPRLDPGRIPIFADIVIPTLGFVVSSVSGTGSDIPANGADVEFIIEYVGVPTSDYPLYVELPAGQLLKNLYDGVYSDQPPRIRYDSTAMTALVENAPFARTKITEPIEDIRTWTEDAFYKPLGLAPSIDKFGRIRPVGYSLPDASVTPFQLNDTNIVSGSWMHSSQDIANKVVFKYQREYVDANSKEIYTSGVSEREVEYTDIAPSFAFLGDHKIEYESSLFRAIGYHGGALGGNASDETAVKMAQFRALDLFNRFSYGVQRMVVKAQRQDAAVAAAQVGDWAYVASSYMPDYVTGKRGINRIAQIIAVKDVDPTCREFTLLDGGPNSAPLAQPTLSGVVLTNGSAVVTVSSVPTGAAVIVEYALNSTLPGANDKAWMFAGQRMDAGTIITPVLLPGQTCWVRARAVTFNRRPSANTNALSVAVPAAPAVVDFAISTPDGSDPIVTWTPLSGAAGVRIVYEVYSSTGVPTGTMALFGERDAALGKATLTGINVRQLMGVSVGLTTYPVFSGGVCSGVPGIQQIRNTRRISANYVAPTLKEVASGNGATGTLTLVPIDPQYRLTLVESSTAQGAAAFSAFGTLALTGSNTYVATVTLTSKQQSRIAYKYSGIKADGSIDIIDQNVVTFNVASTPLPPQVSIRVGEDGTFYVDVITADTEATGFVVTVSGDIQNFTGSTGTYTYPFRMAPNETLTAEVYSNNTGVAGAAGNSPIVKKSGTWIPITSGNVNPSAGAGISAPIGSAYVNKSTGIWYNKVGSGNTAWTAFASAVDNSGTWVGTTNNLSATPYGSAPDAIAGTSGSTIQRYTATAIANFLSGDIGTIFPTATIPSATANTANALVRRDGSGIISIGGILASSYLTFTNAASGGAYIITNENASGTGALGLQAGLGSAGYGGSIMLYAASHATRGGYVEVGLGSSNSARKFQVANLGIGNGTVVFTVDTNGAVVIGGSTTFSRGQYLFANTNKVAYFDTTTNYLYSGGAGGLRINNAADTVNIVTISDAGNIAAADGFSLGGGSVNLNRVIGAALGSLSFYNTNYTAWRQYMAPNGAGNGPVGIVPPTGSYVTSWALRSFIESSSGYGFTWEAGTATSTSPAVVMELTSGGAAGTATNILKVWGDMMARRTSSTGVVYFGDAAAYLQYNGTQFDFSGKPLQGIAGIVSVGDIASNSMHSASFVDTVTGKTIAPVIVSTAAPTGTAPNGTLWIQVQ